MKQKNNEKSFTRKCPLCEAKDKVVMKCKKCYKFICQECEINGICTDCYVEVMGNIETGKYFDDKYLEGDPALQEAALMLAQ